MFSNKWNYGQHVIAELSGGSSVPTTPSLAFGTGLVALSNDGFMGIAFVGVSGACCLLHPTLAEHWYRPSAPLWWGVGMCVVVVREPISIHRTPVGVPELVSWCA